MSRTVRSQIVPKRLKVIYARGRNIGRVAFAWSVVATNCAVAQGFNGAAITFGEAFPIQGCRNRFAVASPTGYAIILWVGGAPVITRDLLSGNLKTVGQTTLRNNTRKQNTLVYIEQYNLSLQTFRSIVSKRCS